jgi:DNA modification methylase
VLIRGDARALPLRDGCAQCVVTSPPYWGLRDYGSPGQIGLESTPDAYVQTMVQVFAEVWRVLKDDGTCWLNLGDSYVNAGHSSPVRNKTTNGMKFAAQPWKSMDGMKSKDLVGIPWRVAFALQAAGWYLRSDIIWAKPNPMPESVTDRPTKAHEYIFLLSKHERYFYDAAAIAEPALQPLGIARTAGTQHKQVALGKRVGILGTNHGAPDRNKRSVWSVATQPYSGAHFATFPEALIEPCILAGSRPGDLVLDPFVGSGTVGTVCERFGRRWVGTDLAYQHLSHARTLQRGLRFIDDLEAGA